MYDFFFNFWENLPKVNYHKKVMIMNTKKEILLKAIISCLGFIGRMEVLKLNCIDGTWTLVLDLPLLEVWG